MAIQPLIVIVGPTASGKTGLSVEIAKKYNGEIICADSRTIYTGMDIGTAKATKIEQLQVPHWGIDLIEPGQRFTAYDFQQYAQDKITDIRRRGKTPFLVGGTGLYVDSVLFNYQFGVKSDEGERRKLEKMSIEELHKYCEKNNIKIPENRSNKRYVIRSIERRDLNVVKDNEQIYNSCVVGISTEKDILRTRISNRVEQLFVKGVVDEAKILGEKYGWNNEAMTGNIYPLCKALIDGELSIDDVKNKLKSADWKLAKRQMTWFRRNDNIQWFSLSEAEKYICSTLDNTL